MSQSIALQDMTAAEARSAVEIFVNSGMRLRWMLLEMFERRAHKALHYTSFEDFADKELALVLDKTALSRLIHWAQVERNISGQKLTLGQLSVQELSTALKEIPKIPRTVALELAKLPDPEAQRKAWGEYYERSEAHKSGQVGARYATTELKHVVASTLANGGNSKPKTDPAPSKPVTAPPVPPKPTAPSFTPAPDPETIEEAVPIDWEEAEWIMELAGSWVKAKAFNAPKPSLCNTVAMLRRIADWIEEGCLS